jgi:hypothetical protein
MIVLYEYGNMNIFYLWKGDKITMRAYRVLTSVECTTVMTVVHTVTSGLVSSLD